MSQKIISLISLTLITLSFSACSSTSPSKKVSSASSKECGENTLFKGVAVGAIAGGIAAKALNKSALAGAAIGGIVGGIGGQQLSTMQCNYKGKEATLLKEIDSSISEQQTLVTQTKELNHKMSKLYNEIELLESTQGERLATKEQLLTKVALKKEEVLKLQSLNHSVKLEIEAYYKKLKTNNYSKKDNKSIEYSLKNLISSLKSIEASSLYNLDQLNKFTNRVNRV